MGRVVGVSSREVVVGGWGEGGRRCVKEDIVGQNEVM